MNTVFAAIFFFIENFRGKEDGQSNPKNLIAKQILYYSRHISKYYALHTIVYFIALGINGYAGFKIYMTKSHIEMKRSGVSMWL